MNALLEILREMMAQLFKFDRSEKSDEDGLGPVGKGVLAVLAIAAIGWGTYRGCGRRPDWVPKQLAPVTGTVTLDGQPLAGATVIFEGPEGLATAGLTDEDGRYSVRFFQYPGAAPGKNIVRITKDALIGETPPPGFKPLPKKYNTSTTLSVEVENKRNTFDFDLSTAP